MLSRLGGVKSATSIPLAWIWGVRGLSVEEIGAWPFGWKPVGNNIKKNKYPIMIR